MLSTCDRVFYIENASYARLNKLFRIFKINNPFLIQLVQALFNQRKAAICIRGLD